MYQEFVYMWGGFLSYWTQKIGFSINIFIGKPVVTIAILLKDIIYVNYTMLSCCKGIIYVNYAMPCCWANHHVCELYHAIIFLYYVFHLSTTFVYPTTLPVHQPFELVMEKSGVKTRTSEQTMLPAEADILLVTDSSSEEDSEADAVLLSPWGVCSSLAGLCCSYRAYGVSHCYVIWLV